MNIPFQLTPTQQGFMLEVIRKSWPEAKSESLDPTTASNHTLAAWHLSENNIAARTFEKLALQVTGGQLTLTEDGSPCFTCKQVDFVYENGTIHNGIFCTNNSVTRSISFGMLFNQSTLQNACQELRRLASKIPVPSNAA